VLVAVTIACMTVAAAAVPQQAPPRFQSGVDVISVDATVVDGDGRPIRDLAASDFSVRIDGRSRRVISAEFVSTSQPAVARPRAAVPDGYAANDTETGGRMIVIAFDQVGIPFTALA